LLRLLLFLQFVYSFFPEEFFVVFFPQNRWKEGWCCIADIG
jgi:hypothetical protein